MQTCNIIALHYNSWCKIRLQNNKTRVSLEIKLCVLCQKFCMKKFGLIFLIQNGNSLFSCYYRLLPHRQSWVLGSAGYEDNIASLEYICISFVSL